MSRQQRFGLVALAVAVAVGAFFIARPDDDDEPAGSGAAAPTQPEQTAPAETQTVQTQPVQPVFRVGVEGGEPADGVEEFEVERGETVRLTVTSDSPQEVHVHGYDIIESAAPGSPARFRFEADAEGVFEVELEGSHTQIAELRVVP